MKAATTLAGQAYVLAFDRDRDRPVGRAFTGYLLRAALLAELWSEGWIADVDGRATTTGGGDRPRDPLLAAVLDEIRADTGRWPALIKRGRPETLRAVVAQLETSGAIRVTRPARRFRSARTELRDPLLHTRLAERVGATLRGATPVARLPLADVVLIGLLAVAGTRSAISRTQRKEYADRIAQCVTASGPAVSGLRRALKQARSSIS